MALSTFYPYSVPLIWQKVQKRCTLLLKISFILRVVLEYRKVCPYFLNSMSSQTTPHNWYERSSILCIILKDREVNIFWRDNSEVITVMKVTG